MKRKIRLTETELISMIKKVISEAAPEVRVSKEKKVFGYFHFAEGKSIPTDYNGKQINNAVIDSMAELIAEWMEMSGTLEVLEEEYDTSTGTPNLPKFINLRVGTSHSGTPEANSKVAQARLEFLKSLVVKAFDKLGISSENITALIMTDSNVRYDTSSLSRLYDPSKVKTRGYERFGDITIYKLVKEGLDTQGILGVQQKLYNASSDINNIFFDLVDEKEIVQAIMRLSTPSDISDLDRVAQTTKFGSLENFLNRQLVDDPKEKNQILYKLRDIAKNYGIPQDIVSLRNGDLIIGKMR